MMCRYRLFIFITVTLNLVLFTQSIPKRFEYKYSFKGPYLAQKDNQVPFWTYSGSAIASEESFRITPSLRSQKGQAWAKNPTNFEWWEVEMVFRVNGRGRIGADGLAFWFTTTQMPEGPVFGSADMWNGFGLFFDSFDNDNKRNNPYIMGMVNDGTLKYDHDNDGSSQQMGGCLRDFRNKPFPIRVKIEYYINTITVSVHSGMTDSDRDFEICFKKEQVTLPSSGYFGVTAATGGLADDHDVIKFLVHSLRSTEELAKLKMSSEEEEQFQREFEEYQQKTQKARDDYIALHPDAGKTEEQQYETDEQRELNQIFQGQGQIFHVIKQLNGKLDDILARQERTLSLVSGGQIQVAQPGQAAPSAVDGIYRHEVNSLLTNQNDVVAHVRDLKTSLNNLQGTSQQILAHSQRGQGSAQPVGGSYDMHVTLKELNEGLNIVKRDLSFANQKLGSVPAGGGSGSGGECPSCVSTTMFIVLMTVQGVVLIGYLIYRDSKEAKAKKFY